MRFPALSAQRDRFSWAGLVVRLVLAAVWAWAGLAKIGNPRAFVQVMRAYDATPEWLSKTIGYGLPALELVVAVLLLIGLITRYAAAVSAVLLLLFLGVTLQAAARGLEVRCGCFGGGGPSTSTSYTWDFLGALALLVLSAFLIRWPLTRLSVDEAIIASERVPELTPKQRKFEKNVRRYRAAVAAAEVELRHKQRFTLAGAAAVLVLVSFIAIGVQSGRASISPDADIPNAGSATGVKVGNQQAPVLVDLYEDFQCAACGQLEQGGLSKDLADKVKATSIKVNYHMVSLLDSLSNGNRYSSRAANAGYCAANQSPDAFVKFHDVLYGKGTGGMNNQPAENSKGKPDSQLIEWGKQAGITSADFSTCVTSDQHKELVAGVTDSASKRGVSGVPTVFVNGSRVNGVGDTSVTVAEIDAAIQQALSKAKSTAAPSPTPSATPSSRTSTPASTSPAKTSPAASPSPSASNSAK